MKVQIFHVVDKSKVPAVAGPGYTEVITRLQKCPNMKGMPGVPNAVIYLEKGSDVPKSLMVVNQHNIHQSKCKSQMNMPTDAAAAPALKIKIAVNQGKAGCGVGRRCTGDWTALRPR